MAAKDAECIYIVGDLFDFWFEYKRSVPKGFTRILGKLAELTDAGLSIIFFTGNHDLWMSGYFENELHIPVLRQPISKEIQGRRFFIGHGDGLGPGDYGFKVMKKIFTNRFCQSLFRWLHPDVGIALAHFWSKRSRYANGLLEEYKGSENEWLLIYSKEKQQQQPHDFYIFGHRHLPLDISIEPNSRYINLGDWLNYNSYAVFDGHNIQLLSFTNHPQVPLRVDH